MECHSTKKHEFIHRLWKQRARRSPQLNSRLTPHENSHVCVNASVDFTLRWAARSSCLRLLWLRTPTRVAQWGRWIRWCSDPATLSRNWLRVFATRNQIKDNIFYCVASKLSDVLVLLFFYHPETENRKLNIFAKKLIQWFQNRKEHSFKQTSEYFFYIL